VLAQLWATYELPPPGFGPRGWSIEYLFVGTDGMLDVEYYSTCRLGKGGSWQTVYEHPRVDIVRDPLDPNRIYPYTDQLQDLVDRIADGGRPLVTGEDGRAGIEMALAADRSAATRSTISLPLTD
jgi:predicted dehydrogenase